MDRCGNHTATPPKGGPVSTEYWLNEAQALLVMSHQPHRARKPRGESSAAAGEAASVGGLTSHVSSV
jgi:hypothetical protein